ncbi:hypothetical protein [Trichothermofontia sp.]
MFFDELSPVVKELAQHPVAFLGGLCSGLLRLNLDDDPVRSWLDQQAGEAASRKTEGNGKTTDTSRGPQSITIE